MTIGVLVGVVAGETVGSGVVALDFALAQAASAQTTLARRMSAAPARSQWESFKEDCPFAILASQRVERAHHTIKQAVGAMTAGGVGLTVVYFKVVPRVTRRGVRARRDLVGDDIG